MTLSGWQWFAATAALATVAGIVFWLLASLGLKLAGLLSLRPPFAQDLLAAPGENEKREYRRLGSELAALLASLLAAAVIAVSGGWLLGAIPAPAVPAWAWGIALPFAAVVVAFAGYCIVCRILARRRLRFAWAAKNAIGNILKRLNLAGNSIFHGVMVDGACIDHVVIGRKGVFALNVVARRIPKGAGDKPQAELNHGKLRLGESTEALPVGDAARNMTLLSTALTRIVGHRVPVRSVLVVPGWNTLPNGEGNHLVLNDRNLAMLTSWNTPDAHLMDEDCATIHAWLHEASRIRQMV